MAIHSSGQTVFSLSHIEGITMDASEEVDEVAGGANGKLQEIVLQVTMVGVAEEIRLSNIDLLTTIKLIDRLVQDAIV